MRGTFEIAYNTRRLLTPLLTAHSTRRAQLSVKTQGTEPAYKVDAVPPVFRCEAQTGIAARPPVANNEQSLEESRSLHARNLIFTNLYGYFAASAIAGVSMFK